MKKPKLIKMNDNEWFKKFKPIKNQIDPNASWDGHMFETYGEELEYVLKRANAVLGDHHVVWTWVDGDNDSFICEGYHLCNRIGYFITEKQYNSNSQYIISL